MLVGRAVMDFTRASWHLRKYGSSLEILKIQGIKSLACTRNSFALNLVPKQSSKVQTELRVQLPAAVIPWHWCRRMVTEGVYQDVHRRTHWLAEESGSQPELHAMTVHKKSLCCANMGRVDAIYVTDPYGVVSPF